MAVASPVVCASESVDRLRISSDCGAVAAGLEESGGGVIQDGLVRPDDERVYVAVGKDLKESKSVLVWALKNCGAKKICVLHVHQPAQMIPLMGTKFPAERLKEEEVRAYRVLERVKMQKILNDYISYCARVGGVQAEKMDIEKDNIEQGIVELVAEHGIRRLVMGAAAEKHYSKKLKAIKSKKALHVYQKANKSCVIWFICKGYLIHTRKSSMDDDEIGLNLAIPTAKSTEAHQLRSKSLSEGESGYKKLTKPVQDIVRRARSAKVDSYAGSITASSSPDVAGEIVTSKHQWCEKSGAIEWAEVTRRSSSQVSRSSLSTRTLDSFSLAGDGLSEDGSLLPPLHEDDICCSSPNDKLEVRPLIYNQLLQAMAEVENLKREAFEESLKRQEAETVAMEAILKAKSSENLYDREMKQRKDMEDALVRETLELKTLKSKLDEVMQELQITKDQKSTLESQITESDQAVKELEDKVACAVELLCAVRKQRDEALIEREIVIGEAEELKKRIEEETTSLGRPLFLSEFSFLEIAEATHNFDKSVMIGEGGFGCVYKGLLRSTEVAIKLLRSHSLQGCSEFQQEVDVLSRVRHPNLVTLVGACSEAGSLIYEYLPNGSLEDHLTCKDNTPPLTWQMRINIAVEICSALVFLHFNKPYSIIHGDLKPSNILLDSNFISKLSDFGICRLIPSDNGAIETGTYWRTTPKGTFAYMDPEFLATGELTPKSDVYSFGIILLRLLTGKPALGIVKEVEYAIEKGNLSTVLDESAGNWPFVQAKQLAHLALRCCEMKRKNRPDLRSDVWRVLEPMKASCGSSSSFRLGPMEHFRVPTYFVCPIFQEIMRDPHTAADGFTYEGEALRGWLDGGHDTSPMTGLKLEHCNMIPNHALRSAIQEWLEQR